MFLVDYLLEYEAYVSSSIWDSVCLCKNAYTMVAYKDQKLQSSIFTPCHVDSGMLLLSGLAPKQKWWKFGETVERFVFFWPCVGMQGNYLPGEVTLAWP